MVMLMAIVAVTEVVSLGVVTEGTEAVIAIAMVMVVMRMVAELKWRGQFQGLNLKIIRCTILSVAVALIWAPRNCLRLREVHFLPP